jgi:peptidoglycan/xylan/chitin deacetylase (PgdA/CDA1 family)
MPNEPEMMPSARSKERDLERARRREALKRQRRVALAVLVAIAALVAVTVFFISSGSSGTNNQLRRQQAAAAAKQAALQKARADRAQQASDPASWPSDARTVLAGLTTMISSKSAVQEKSAAAQYAAQGLPLYCGGSKGRYIALTFDDGPGPYTHLALKILADAHVKATFFLVGQNVGPWSIMARDERLAGNAVGIHTWSHPSLTGLPRAQAISQLASTRTAIVQAEAGRAILMRPPYGNRNAAVDAIIRKLGLVDVLWSIDSADSQGADWRGIARNVLSAVKPGSIILMHENRGQTIRALKYKILPALKRRGFIPVTIPELLVLDPPTPGSQSYCY